MNSFIGGFNPVSANTSSDMVDLAKKNWMPLLIILVFGFIFGVLWQQRQSKSVKKDHSE